IRRKFSDTLLDRLVGPFVSGIYAGDPEKLSLRAAFPILYEAEKASGSILRGVFKVMKQRSAARAAGPQLPREKATLQTFRDGNETLIRALMTRLGESLLLNVMLLRVEALENSQEPEAPRFRAILRDPKGEETVETERLILSIPTREAGKALDSLD